MKKVLIACGAGMGSSQLLKMNAEKVFKELEMDVQIHHCAIDEARSSARQYDIVIVNERFVETLPEGLNIVGLKNILDRKELKEKIQLLDVE